LALTLALPLNGWLVDRMGPKAVYLWCFTAFTLCSALCGLAWSVDSLIAFRVLQGIGGGLLAPMTLNGSSCQCAVTSPRPVEKSFLRPVSLPM
jgi:MFS family permease